MPAISCRDLTKRYGTVVALDGLDLEVPRGSLFGFLGPNGAGKTTVMRILLGLGRATSGTASVLGLDAGSDSLRIRARVGYLPQQPRFPPELTAREVVRYARGFFPRERDSRVEDDISDVLDLVGLTAKANSRSGDLSGGQRQRLGIAQAQIHHPELLILDEPAAALDPLGRRDVLEVMRRLQDSATVFYSTHILDDVQHVSDEVAILKDGRRVIQSSLDDVLTIDRGRLFTVGVAGDTAAAVAALGDLSWVEEVSSDAEVHRQEVAGAAELTVRVTDEDAAYRSLLRELLRNEHVEVTRFEPVVSELEDVFIELVEGGTR